MSTADPLVVVCRDPRDRERARVRLSKLYAFDFDAFSDGSRSRFFRAMLVAYLDPAEIEDGELRRPASHGPAPNRVKVAIPRTQNQAVYPIIERRAAAARIASLAPVARQRMRLDAPAIPQRPSVPVGPKALDVVAIRARTGLSPSAFATYIGTTLFTVRNWETGRTAPEGAARTLLAMLDLNPSIIEQTLRAVA